LDNLVIFFLEVLIILEKKIKNRIEDKVYLISRNIDDKKIFFDRSVPAYKEITNEFVILKRTIFGCEAIRILNKSLKRSCSKICDECII
jgi:hypothetical protein